MEVASRDSVVSPTPDHGVDLRQVHFGVTKALPSSSEALGRLQCASRRVRGDSPPEPLGAQAGLKKAPRLNGGSKEGWIPAPNLEGTAHLLEDSNGVQSLGDSSGPKISASGWKDYFEAGASSQMGVVPGSIREFSSQNVGGVRGV